MSRLTLAPGLACLAGLCLVAASGRSEASFTGFGDGTGFTLNGDAVGVPTISNGVLTLTNGLGSESRSTFYTTAQTISRFTAQFTYQDVNGGADGAAFVIQNSPSGVNAVGVGGSSFGYGQLTQSVGVLLSIFSPSQGTGLGTNGSTPGSTPPSSFGPTGGVALAGGDPIQINLSYDGATLTETLRDLSSTATFTTSYAVNIAAFTGSDTAFVGFTGGTGALTATQRISNVSFTNNATIPEPASLALLAVGLAGVLAYGRLRQGH